MADLYQDPQATTRRRPMPKPGELAGFDVGAPDPNLAGVQPVSSGGNLAGASGSGNLADLGRGGAPAPAQTVPHSPSAPASTAASAQAAPNPADPFAAIGGGVQLAGGEWVPKGHPLAATAAQAPAAAPTAPPPQATSLAPSAPPVAPPAPTSPDPFAAIGGGVQLPTGEWVPQGHPLAQQGGATPAAPTPAAPAASADPFASVGGGVQLPTGEWVPRGTAADPWKGVGADIVAATPAGTSLVGQPPAAPPAAPPPAVAPPVAPAAPIGDNLSGDILSLLDAPTKPAPTSLAPQPAQTVAEPTAAEQVPTAFREALLKMLGDAQKPASLDDPALKGQADAFSLAQTRARDRARSALAERAAAQGGTGVDSGAFDRDLAGLFQQQGEAEGAFNANLLADAGQQKIAQLQSALTMMGSDVNSAEGRALTRELANAQLREGARQFEAEFGLAGKKLGETIRQFDVTTEAGKQQLAQQHTMFREQMAQQGKQFDVDAALKRLGIESQTNLGAGDLALRDKLGSAGLNAQIMQMLMQNQQFGQRLGADVGMFNSSQNQSFLNSLLGQLGA